MFNRWWKENNKYINFFECERSMKVIKKDRDLISGTCSFLYFSGSRDNIFSSGAFSILVLLESYYNFTVHEQLKRNDHPQSK